MCLRLRIRRCGRRSNLLRHKHYSVSRFGITIQSLIQRLQQGGGKSGETSSVCGVYSRRGKRRVAQSPPSSGGRGLRTQLQEVTDKEAALRERSQKLEEEMEPQNVERSVATVGTTDARALRDQRRQQLERQKAQVDQQLTVWPPAESSGGRDSDRRVGGRPPRPRRSPRRAPARAARREPLPRPPSRPRRPPSGKTERPRQVRRVRTRSRGGVSRPLMCRGMMFPKGSGWTRCSGGRKTLSFFEEI